MDAVPVTTSCGELGSWPACADGARHPVGRRLSCCVVDTGPPQVPADDRRRRRAGAAVGSHPHRPTESDRDPAGTFHGQRSARRVPSRRTASGPNDSSPDGRGTPSRIDNERDERVRNSPEQTYAILRHRAAITGRRVVFRHCPHHLSSPFGRAPGPAIRIGRGRPRRPGDRRAARGRHRAPRPDQPDARARPIPSCAPRSSAWQISNTQASTPSTPPSA